MKQIGDHITIKRVVRSIFRDGKGPFFNGSESDDSDNDDENYMKIMNSSSYLRVLLIIAAK